MSVVVGARRIRRLRPALGELRRRVGQAHDAQTCPDWFVSRTLVWDALPVVVVHSVDQVPQSAVLLHVRRWRGMRTGVLKCGDLAGDGGVIAPVQDRARVVARAADALLDSGLGHTMIATLRPGTPLAAAGCRPGAGDGETWQPREVFRQLDLAGGLDAFLSRQSRKFRRNFRYYRRRAEVDLGCRFLPDLTAEQSRSAVRALHGQGRYPVPARRAGRHEAALRATPGSFAMGLVDREGRWLSYLAGWKQGDATFVEWQLNVEDEAASLVTAMRSFFLEHDAMRGAQSVVFVGGTTGAWARACRPEVCFDLLRTGRGPIGRSLAALLAWLRPHGQVGLLHRNKTARQARQPQPADAG